MIYDRAMMMRVHCFLLEASLLEKMASDDVLMVFVPLLQGIDPTFLLCNFSSSFCCVHP
jgi:hypothetical protein